MNQKRPYSEEFKREAVTLWKSSGKSLAQRSKELGVSDHTLYGWKKRLEEHGGHAFPGSGPNSSRRRK
jgi:transposase